MASFTFENILKETPSFENNEVYIWIWNADKIPPHLGFSCGRNYLSLTYKGVEDFQAATVFRKAKRHHIPMVFIKLKTEPDQHTLLHTFDVYQRAKPGGATCLSPIKDLLHASADIIQLAHLLQFLKMKSEIEAVFGLNLSDDYKSLPEYGWQDIVKRIETLDAAK